MQTGTYKGAPLYQNKYVMQTVVDDNGKYTDYVMDKKTYDKYLNSEYANTNEGIVKYAKEDNNVHKYTATNNAIYAMNKGTIDSVPKLTALNHDEVISLCNSLKTKNEDLEQKIKMVEDAMKSLENTMYTKNTQDQIKILNEHIDCIRKHIDIMAEIINLFEQYADDIESGSSSLNGGRY